MILERVTFHGSLCSKRFCSLVSLERHGHELMGSMLTHWSESSYHGCMLLVFPNDSAHSFFLRGMDVKTAEASIVISQSHVCPRVCYMHFSLASHCEVHGSESELALCC